MFNRLSKRIFTIGICLLLFLSLTACSTNIIPEKTTEPTTPSQDDYSTLKILLAPPVTTEKYNSLKQALPRINDAADDLVFHDLGIHVSLTLMTTDDYWRDLFSLLSEYDLLADQYGVVEALAKRGDILDLKLYLADGGNSILNTYEFPELVTAFEVNGGLYGLPAHQAAAVGPAVLFNKEVFTEYGFDASGIRTFADIEMLYEKVSASESDMYMTQLSRYDAYTYPPLFHVPLSTQQSLVSLTGDVENDAAVRCLYETDEFQEWAEYLCRWYDRGWFYPSLKGTSTISSVQITANSLTPKVVKAINPVFELVGNKKVFSFYNPEYNPYTLPYYEEYCDTELVAVPLGNVAFTNESLKERYYWMVPASSGHPEDAVRLLEYMNTSQDFMNLLNWGQENKDYVIGNDDLFDFPSDDRSELWHLDKGDYLPNQYMLTPWAGHDPSFYDDMQNYGRSALRSKLLSFEFDNTPVEEEITNCSSVYLSYVGSGEEGFPDSYDLSQMIEEMKAAGLDIILAECQRQADAFLAGE